MWVKHGRPGMANHLNAWVNIAVIIYLFLEILRGYAVFMAHVKDKKLIAFL